MCPLWFFHLYRVTPTTDTFSFNWDLVKDDILKTLSPYKALGPDKISPKDLKLSQESLVQGLFEVFEKSKDSYKFPKRWKQSQVTAIFKKGNKLDPNNYRPVSLLSVPGLLLERVICKSVDDHTLSNNILNNRQ